MGPLAIPDNVRRSNPKIDELMAQRAIQTGMGTPQGIQDAPGVPPQEQAPQPKIMAPMTPAAQPKPLAKVQPIEPSGNERALQGQYNNVSTHGSGISQIKNPVGRTLLTALDAIGSGLFPRIAEVIPGTQAHHEELLGQTQGALEHEQKNRAQTSTEQEQTQRAAELESRPELAQVKNELGQAQLGERTRGAQAEEDIKRARLEGEQSAKRSAQDLADRKAGYRRSDTGDLEVIPYEEMTPEQQVNHDLKSSQRELADATAMLRQAQAQKDPKNEALAMQRLDIANRRLALSQATYNARYLGTGVDNQPLPGAMLTDENKPVGTVNAANVRPTGTERNKADMGISAKEQLADIKKIVQGRPDIFGPAAGRKTDFTVWLGSQDPDAQAFRAARTIAADHLAGTFGGRSEAALDALDTAIGHYKDNPAAIVKGIDQIEKANDIFIQRGSPKTAGSETSKAATSVPYSDGGKTYNIPAGQEREFLKDHPNAKKANAGR